MLDAIINGKLSREQENMEDILTSIVFGMIKYLPPHEALFPLLSKAELQTGEKPFEIFSSTTTTVDVDYLFWPLLQESSKHCEPDVLITISFSDKRKFIILIEAKYHSGKSSVEDDFETPNDQLAKEWINLKALAQKENAEPYLIYLTSDYSFPVEQINESQQELLHKEKEKGVMCWLSWRHIPLLDEIEASVVLKDIAKLLREKMKMIFYEGISISNSNFSINWKYEIVFNWSVIPLKSKWQFSVTNS